MANNDWDLDDLLDFKFDREVPERNKDFDILNESEEAPKHAKPESGKKGLGETFDAYDELKRYEEIRRRSKESAQASGASEPLSHRSFERSERDDRDIFEQFEEYERLERSDRGQGASRAGRHAWINDPVSEAPAQDRARVKAQPSAPVEEADEPMLGGHGAKELEAIKQASHDAYERYRSNYTKTKKKREGARGGRGGRTVSKFHKVLTTIYVIAFAAFVGSMTFMNVLPIWMAIALYGALILVSLFILVKTRSRDSEKKAGKRFATVLACLLIVFYGIGTVYATGTLSFLSGSSVDNSAAVSDIRRVPFNFTITGIDVDGTIDEQGRSDVNMVVTVNPKTHQILMTSIPRDYEIYMPDFDNAMDKLTHTGFYGVQTTIGAEEQLLDTTINYYVKVNFTTVERFIDAVGGVDVESEYEFTPVKLKDWTVQEGMNHMNGKQALAFARERKAFATGDNQRIRNQQLVFEALIKKATSSRTMILSYNKVLTSLRSYFEMSFSSREVRRLIRMQLALDPDWQIYKNTISGGDATMDTYSAGYAYVMSQDEESIENAKTLINAVLNGQTLLKDEDGNVTVASE